MRFVFSAALMLGLAFTAFSQPALPRKSPEFAIDQANGQRIMLSSLRGKVCIMEFAFTTCPHCQRESQMLMELYKEFGPRGFQPVTVAFQEGDALRVAGFQKEFNITYPVGYAPREEVEKYLSLSVMDRYVVPQLAVIDRKGMIREQSAPTGTPNLQDHDYLHTLIEKLLKEGQPASGTKKPATAKKAS